MANKLDEEKRAKLHEYLQLVEDSYRRTDTHRKLYKATSEYDRGEGQ